MLLPKNLTFPYGIFDRELDFDSHEWSCSHMPPTHNDHILGLQSSFGLRYFTGTDTMQDYQYYYWPTGLTTGMPFCTLSPPYATGTVVGQAPVSGGQCFALGQDSLASQSWVYDTVAQILTVTYTGGESGRFVCVIQQGIEACASRSRLCILWSPPSLP